MLIVVAPRRSSIRMSQGDTGAPCAASATAMNSFPVFLACASAAPGMPTAVAKRRHLCTRFAFNPWAIATAATDAPACAHCANTRDFSSTLCLRLGSRLDSCMVPTSFVGGHHLRYQRIRLQYATARRLPNSCQFPNEKDGVDWRIDGSLRALTPRKPAKGSDLLHGARVKSRRGHGL